MNTVETIPPSDPRTDRITSAIWRFQRDLRLGHWDIRYDPKWSKRMDKDASAITRVDPNHMVACVHIDPTVTRDNIDFHVAHELTHLAVWELHQMLGELAAKSGPGGLAIIDLMAVEIERICNRVAHALTGVLYEPVGEKDRKNYAPWVS